MNLSLFILLHVCLLICTCSSIRSLARSPTNIADDMVISRSANAGWVTSGQITPFGDDAIEYQMRGKGLLLNSITLAKW